MSLNFIAIKLDNKTKRSIFVVGPIANKSDTDYEFKNLL